MSRNAVNAESPLSRLSVVCASLPVADLMKGDRRLEGEAYLTGGFGIRRTVEGGGANYARLSELADVWMPGRLKAVQASAGHGVPYLAATQLFAADPAPRKWLASERVTDLEQRKVHSGWILLARSGTNNVGEVMISYAAHEGAIVSDDLLRIQVRNSDSLGFVYAFLKGRYGHAMLRSSQYGSIIKHLQPEHLCDLPIPVPGDGVRDYARQKIGAAFRLRVESYDLTRQARTLYAKTIGVVPQLTPDDEAGFSVPADSLFRGKRRLDGYHYNPLAAAVLAAIGKSGYSCSPLSSLVKSIFYPNRFKRVHASAGTPYLSSEDLFKINQPADKFIASPPRNPDHYFVKHGWILVACSGQIYGLNGSSMLATARHENMVITHDLIRVVPSAENGVRPGYLLTALGHPTYGRPLVLRSAYGTSIPHLTSEDLEDFPVVRLDRALEAEIAKMAERASDLQVEANDAENEAVQAVEQAVAGLIGSIAAVGSPVVESQRAVQKQA